MFNTMRITTMVLGGMVTLSACDDAGDPTDERRLQLASEIAEATDVEFEVAEDMAREMVEQSEVRDAGPAAAVDSFNAASDPQAAGCTVVSTTIGAKVATAYGNGSASACMTACANWAYTIAWSQSPGIAFQSGSPHKCTVYSKLGFR